MKYQDMPIDLVGDGITPQKIADQVVTAVEGGITSWARSLIHNDINIYAIEADKPWYEHIEIYKPSLEMRLTEHDGTIHIITYDDIIDGLLKMKEYYASNTNYDPYQEICDETGDANTASCFMEFIIFGEPTYC